MIICPADSFPGVYKKAQIANADIVFLIRMDDLSGAIGEK